MPAALPGRLARTRRAAAVVGGLARVIVSFFHPCISPTLLRRGAAEAATPRQIDGAAAAMEDDNSYVYEGSDAEEEEYAYSDGDDDAGITPMVLPQVRCFFSLSRGEGWIGGL